MTVLEVLTEVVSAIKALELVAFAKLVHADEMLDALLPVRRVIKLLPTVAAKIMGTMLAIR